MATTDRRWRFWVDRGGTFTDCVARAPAGALHTRKLLSSARAPVEAVLGVLREAAGWQNGAPLPPLYVRMGTTVATNALLQRSGLCTWLAAPPGLGDVLEIGTQERPDLFALDIKKPAPLYSGVVEIPGRFNVQGHELQAFDESAARKALAHAREQGAEALAILGVHSTRFAAARAWEARVAALAEEAGFQMVVQSADAVHETGLLARGETAVADAYLTPLLRAHQKELARALPGAQIRFMQSSGALAPGERFRGPQALLSGPAGGAAGAAAVAAKAGFARAVAFDMGGTSTDVSLVINGECDRVFESRVAGARVLAPMLRIHTIAAGGGSLCRFDGFRLTVGPQSAGARPGPLCYGAADAKEIALSDVNALLGRLRGERFPFPLHLQRAQRAFGELQARCAAAGFRRSADELAAGFLEIANENMAQAIQEVSVGRGVDPRDFALVGFGGAAGQHVCSVARRLGIRHVLLHPLAGLLSAYGMGMAAAGWDGQRDAGRAQLNSRGELPAQCKTQLRELKNEGVQALAAEGVAAAQVQCTLFADLRYAGAESALAVAEPADGNYARAFAEAHKTRFGYERPRHKIEATTLRCTAREIVQAVAHETPAANSAAAAAPPPQEVEAWFPDTGRCNAPLLWREALQPGAALEGPALVLESTGAVVIDPGFRATLQKDGLLLLEDVQSNKTVNAGVDSRFRGNGERAQGLYQPDPVRLEVFGNRFMSIAEQMGAVLRNTALSTNIKERLDYSCAVFDSQGGLVANAPHIPVHLGAMGATVRAVREAIPTLRAGDAVVTNSPQCGGSHLPDVTVVSPVFESNSPGMPPVFYVANRGHHADLGGITPGSMPAHSATLGEEGVLIRPMLLVRGGKFARARMRRVLARARFPARNPADNIADLEAQVAANNTGARLLQNWLAEIGREAALVTMAQLQYAAGEKVSREISRIRDAVYALGCSMDNGAEVRVNLRVHKGRMTADFSQTSPAQNNNLNAPRAVVESAVIYVLRCLVAENIPLNGGCLEPVEIRIPANCLLNPPPGGAVVGGNVETSQRVVDVLLGALGLAAASQGTMNNITFGNQNFGYYETVGGGAGATKNAPGASGVHTHMTNTRITDPEVLEARAPVIVREFSLRRGSGGAGRMRGGDGLIRELQFTEQVEVSLLTQRRALPPWGLAGGGAGARGRNVVLRAAGGREELPACSRATLSAGDRLRVETPGGGGYGAPDG